jgi:hypothetical protein
MASLRCPHCKKVSEFAPRIVPGAFVGDLLACARCGKLCRHARWPERVLALLLLFPFIVLLAGFVGVGLYLLGSMAFENTWSVAYLAIAVIAIVPSGAAIRVAARSARRLMSRHALMPMEEGGKATKM